jgi:hypothetical protein
MQGEFSIGQEWNLYSSWKTVRYLIVAHQQANAPEAQVQNLYDPALLLKTNYAELARSFDGNSFILATVRDVLERWDFLCRQPKVWRPNGTGRATSVGAVGRGIDFPQQSFDFGGRTASGDGELLEQARCPLFAFVEVLVCRLEQLCCLLTIFRKNGNPIINSNRSVGS